MWYGQLALILERLKDRYRVGVDPGSTVTISLRGLGIGSSRFLSCSSFLALMEQGLPLLSPGGRRLLLRL